MKKMSEGNQLQMVYIEKLFDEKLLVVEEKLKSIEYKVTTLFNAIDGKNENSLVAKVDRHEKWINETMGKMGIISAIAGTMAAFLFSLAKDILGKVK